MVLLTLASLFPLRRAALRVGAVQVLRATVSPRLVHSGAGFPLRPDYTLLGSFILALRVSP